MSTHDLAATAQAMVAPGKGILAADESVATISKRFTALGIESTFETRRQYRELLLTAPGLSDGVSGVILYDETLRQGLTDGTPFAQVLEEQGVLPGIKVDTGAKPLAGHPGETITEGLDGLRERVAEYVSLGAKFAKWRAVISINTATGLPTDACIHTNAHALARYAALCQEGGLVPIVEPEVLMDGDHSIEVSDAVTTKTLRAVFAELAAQDVSLEQMVLKPSMVIAGKKASRQAGIQEVAEATIRCLLRTCPAAVPGVAFLSGGQSAEVATEHLNAMAKLGPLPWALSFSYGRALQDPALAGWAGDPAKVAAAQAALCHRVACNSAARTGSYTSAMETAA
ncbi:MAG TPA: class I fructose-bisphosphate aldolase [Actinomycetota bacterium]|nr:class I fructose-bisphosphate aldolase [Actinomycetota bacterium]